MSNKLEAAPKSIKDLYSAIKGIVGSGLLEFDVLDFFGRVLDDYNELEAKYQEACETISRCKEEIDAKDKLIEELKSKNMVLSLRTIMTPSCYGLYMENKELKDTLEKDKEFGKKIGKYVAECIREGSDKGIYKLNPGTRIDIHVEETNNMPCTFDRYAIPRISIMFNNTQTEMERDTAEHECEELHEKIDRLWSVNDELNREIEALEKENKGLKRSIAWFNDNI